MRVLRISGLVLMVLFLVVGISYAQTDEEYYNKGIEYSEQGKLKEAIAEFKKALAINPNHAEAHYYLGALYDFKAMFKEAIAEYKKAIAINPNHIKAHNSLASDYAGEWMFEEAIAEYKKIIAIDPNHAEMHYNFGVAHGNRKEGMLDEAIAELKKVIAINPDLAGVHYNLAVGYLYKGQYGLAIEHCDRAIKLGWEVDSGFLTTLEPYRKERPLK